MGEDIDTYRGRRGTFKYTCGQDVVTILCVINFKILRTVGTVMFIGLLLLIGGIESNPGPGKLMPCLMLVTFMVVELALLFRGLESTGFGLFLVSILFVGGLFYYNNGNPFGRSGTCINKPGKQKYGDIFDSDLNPDDMEVFQRPMCLVRTKVAGTSTVLDIETETVEQIAKINWPMVVVSVVGLYRTGKSYLMNRLAGSTNGFALGNTVESKTKGVWAWCKIHPEMPNTVLLLLDTEGLGDVEKGDPSHDNKIFTLATLLCNCLVYNMKGVFDQDALNKLTFITEIARNIRYRKESSEDNKYLNLILPDFVLCLRDFTLVLSNDNIRITEDEYLENSLVEKKDKDEKFNKPRECIRRYFPNRKCLTFPVPGDGNVLKNLETLQFTDLSDEFKGATKRFVSHIFSQKPKELITSKPVNGQMFATLATSYVTAIKQGGVPDVDDAYIAVAKKENEKVTAKAVGIFEKEMGKIVMPLSAGKFEESCTRAQQEALTYFRDNVVHDRTGSFEKQAQMEMDTIWNTMKKGNLGKIQEKCEAKIQEMYGQFLKEKIKQGDFEVAGGYRNFQLDINILKQDYFSSLRAFDDHEILLPWHDFMKTLKESESTIIQADNALTKKEKEDEKMRNEETLKDLLKTHENKQQEALEQQKKIMELHYEKLYKDRLKQLEEEKEKFEKYAREKLEKMTAQEEVARFKEEQERKKSMWIHRRVWSAIWNE